MMSIINIHFFSPALGRALASRPAMMYFAFNDRAEAVVVAHSLRQGEFVAQVPFYPPLQKPEDFTEQACLRVIRLVSGVPDLADVRIEQVRPWVMSAQVAER